MDAHVQPQLVRQVELLLAEAVANAVRHGGASRISIHIERRLDCLRMRVVDNGHGISGLDGKYSHSELVQRGVGPKSISVRAAELGGTLSLSSTSKGVELYIEIPCTDNAAVKSDDQAYSFN